MSETQARSAETDEIRLEWREMAEIAGDLFAIRGGADLRWAEAAWQALSEGGLTDYVLEVERTACIMRSVALSAFYREFCARAFDEGSPGEWEYDSGAGLVGDDDAPVDAFSLGQLAEQWGIFVNNAPHQHPDPRAEAICELARAEYPRVLAALQDKWGKEDLFAALYASREAEVLGGDQHSTGKQIAYEWYHAGADI